MALRKILTSTYFGLGHSTNIIFTLKTKTKIKAAIKFGRERKGGHFKIDWVLGNYC